MRLPHRGSSNLASNLLGRGHRLRLVGHHGKAALLGAALLGYPQNPLITL